MPLAPGKTFGRYVVEAVLGAGGGGEVYRAHDTVLDRPVALKILAAAGSYAVPGEVRSRILREARAAAQLAHPNIVAVFDVGEEDGVPYLAMELVPGGSLRRWIGAALPMEQAIGWLADVALALHAAHKKGLVHRDIKPDNVLVSEEGVAKVVDFGIARQTRVDPLGATGHKTAGDGVGTLHYMAPEQIKNLPLDGRTDQFGWGVLAYELLSGGALPWDTTGGGLRYVAAVLAEPPVPLRDRAPAVPAGVAEVVDRALRRAPEERFETMRQIAEAIDAGRGRAISEVSRPVVSVWPGASHAIAHDPTTPLAAAAPRRRPPRRLRVGLVVVAIFLVVGWLGARARRHKLAAAAQPPASSASSATAETDVMGVPLPQTQNREALAAYISGLAALRDGGGQVALDAFDKAVSLDPLLAGSHLRMAILYLDRDARRGRERYAKARDLRSVLTPHDLGLLDAVEPLVARPEIDAKEAERRLLEVARNNPRDAEVYFYLQLAAGMAGDLDLVRSAGERGLAIDPGFVALVASLGEAQAYAGDLDAAEGTLRRCLSVVGLAGHCAYLMDLVRKQRGECAEIEEENRRVLAANPTFSLLYESVAEVMLERRAPLPAVREMIEQRIATLNKEQLIVTPFTERYRLAVASGDFDAAETEARGYDAAIVKDAALFKHGWAADRFVAIDEETGRLKKAGEVAARMLQANEGWVPDPRVEDQGIEYDVTMPMLAAEREAGLLPDGAYAEKRAEWLARWEAKVPAFFRRYLWLRAYAGPALTPADAKEAVAALEGFGGIPPFRPNSAALIGRVFLLAGDVDRAMPWLEEDARGCFALTHAFADVRARYWLGRGYEAKGDVSRACNAYADVIARWGAAKPRSVTAEEARTHAAGLRCPAEAGR